MSFPYADSVNENTFYTENCLLFDFKNSFYNTDLFNENIL